MAQSDIFDLTFEVLQRSLSVSTHKNDASVMNSLDLAAENLVLKQMRSEESSRREDLARTRNLILEKFRNGVKARLNAITQVEGCRRLCLSTSRQYDHAMQRRLASQRSSSERRMKDLVFEVVGEYGKSNVRIRKRQEYLRKTGRTKFLTAIWVQNWQKFALRLKFDLCLAMTSDRPPELASFLTCQNILQCVHLTPTADKDEWESLVRKLTKKAGLISEQKVIVQAVLKLSKSSREKGLIPSSFRVANSSKELQEIMQILKTWAKRSSPPVPPAAVNASGAGTGPRNTASRSRSASGGGRPRPLPQSNVPVAAPLLKELISTESVAWLNPASYLPGHWDELYLTQYTMDTQISSSNATNEGGVDKDAFASFVRKYHAQHTSNLWSDRAYFCLEERSLATRSDTEANARAMSPDSALLAVLGNIGDANKEEKRAALENAITMQLLSTLQEIYVDHPYVYVSHPHESLRRETAQESLVVLRELLSQPLTVTGFSCKHRLGVAKSNSSKTTQIIHKYLPTVPDIMVVRASNGAVLHFAPAMLAHLPECRSFSSGCLNEEQQRQAVLRCPHPQIMTMSLHGSHYLSTLFCPVLTQLVGAQNVLRDNTGKQSSTGMLNPHSHDHTTSPTAAAAYVATATTGVPSGNKKDRHNHISTEVLPSSPLFMMPMSADCMQALLYRYLVPFSNLKDAGTAGDSTSNKSTSNNPVTHSYCAMNIIPDHARYRVLSAPAGAQTAPDELRKLRCSYVLMPDDRAAEIAAVAESATPRKGGAPQNSPKPSASHLNPCYYLVQVYELLEKKETSGEEAVAGSELDDMNDHHSTTLCLTQSGKAGGGGKSSFDQARIYDSEDDILRATLLEECRAVLSCDVVISPIAKAKESGKGPRAQPAAVEAGGKKTSTGGTSRHMLEEDQDEGDGDGDEDGMSTGGRSSAGSVGSSVGSKRRWDPNILSTVCRWRSCLCDSAVQRVGKSSVYKQKQLCSYHLEMKAFLDSRGGKQGGVTESSKYLPRKAPNFNAGAIQEKKRDMMTIRAASTLLQELWDGKLRATVRSFTKKVVRDMAPRNYLEGSNTTFLIAHPAYMTYLMGNADGNSRSANSPFSVRSYLAGLSELEKLQNTVVPAQPTWAIWKNKAYFDRTLDGQNLSLNILDSILLTEKTILRELEMLADLRAYPSAELVLIRKEVKVFKEQQEAILTKTESVGGKGNAVAVSHREASAAAVAGGVDATVEDVTSGLTSGYDDLVAILSAENKLCERKLLMMGCRRQEEEERRALYLKKQARVKAIEDNQSRDPANFRNQRF